MKRLILFIIVLILSAWIGLKIYEDPGFLLFSYSHWSLQMPLWAAVILIILIFLLLYWLIHIIDYSVSLGSRLRIWSGRRRARIAHQYTNQGLIDLAEGNWKNAEKNLTKRVQDSRTPLINYLGAAKAAQEQEAYDRRDDYLHKAYNVNSQAKIAIGLTQAQLQLDHQQLEQALATLKHLRENKPHHNYILKLLKDLYIKLNDWQGLKELIPELKRYKVVLPDEVVNLEKMVYQKLLSQAISLNKDTIEEVWHVIPKTFKFDPDIVAVYSDFMAIKNPIAAEKLLRDSLRKNWSEKLIERYGLLNNIDSKAQLDNAESWLKTQPKNATLYLTLGRLCITNMQWGKAQSYLQTSIELKPTKQAYIELGNLLQKRHETQAALDCFKGALDIA